MKPYNTNRRLAEKIEPRWYQTNVSLNQPPITAADRPVREYVTNVGWRADQPMQSSARSSRRRLGRGCGWAIRGGTLIDRATRRRSRY